jgi:hypothetical protein
MTTTIEYILRFGTRYTVAFECGHRVMLSPDELRRSQWFVGRKVTCPECLGVDNGA